MNSITQTEVDFKVVETSPGNVVLVRLYQVTEDRYHVMSEQANGNDLSESWFSIESAAGFTAKVSRDDNSVSYHERGNSFGG